MWAVDFRMPPDHPYPLPLDDCVAAYRALLQDHQPDEIIVGGSSSGGNLAAAMILRARDEGLALPAAAVLLTPEADLTESGDTFQTNAGVDTMLRAGTPQRLLYAAQSDARPQGRLVRGPCGRQSPADSVCNWNKRITILWLSESLTRMHSTFILAPASNWTESRPSGI